MVPLVIMFSQTSFSESYYLFNYLKQTSIVFFPLGGGNRFDFACEYHRVIVLPSSLARLSSRGL